MAKELVYKVRIEMDSSSATKSTSRLENTQENAEKAVNKTTAAINRQKEATETNTRSQRNFAKATSNANQTLFSFGDLVNDSAQFQFGFAQGSRAIGNNIGFMAEQFSNVQTRAGSFTAALKAMGSSLLGPGGLILGINIVVTALTVFGDKLFGDSDSVSARAKEARKELVELRKEIDKFDIQFQQLTELQKDAFEDLDQTQALRQQVQFAREIEATLGNRLDAQNQQVEKLQKQVDLLESFEGNNRAILEAQRRGLISRQTAEGLLQGELDLTETIRQKNVLLSEAKIEQSALETSINSANEKQIQLLAKINELEAGRASSTFQALQNIVKAQQARGQQLLGGPAGFEVAQITAEDIMAREEIETGVGTFLKSQLGRWTNFQDMRVEAKKESEEAMTAIERIEARQRAELQRQAVSQSIGALASAFDQFKPLAVAQAVIDGVLAVQKVLANVPPPFNFAAAGAMAAATAKNVQKIIATEPGSVDTGGAGGGGSDRGFGGQAGNFIGNTGQRDPVPPGRLDRIGGSGRRENINVIVRANRKGFAAWVESGNKERKSGVFTLRSDV